MKLLEMHVYRGPNPYGYRPVISMKLDLEELEQHPSDQIPGFVDKLLEQMPSLQEHGCSYGEPGGFVRRLRDGTWFGHITEHVAIELQCLAGTPVTYGKTRSTGHDGVYNIIVSYEEECVGIRACEIALRFLQNILPVYFTDHLADVDFPTELRELVRLAEKSTLGPSTRSIVDEARRRKIPTLRLNENSLVQLGWGHKQQRIQATITSKTSHIGVEIAQDKELTASLLKRAGLPTPRHVRVHSADAAVDAAHMLGYPVVVKPIDLSHGRGVALNLTNDVAVKEAFEQAYNLSNQVLVEEYCQGNDHRVLVIGDRVVAVAERMPGHVVGDGNSTLKQLVDLVNADARRGVGHEKVLTRLEFDNQAERLMNQAGYTKATILKVGEHFALRATGNLSTGGTAIDRTDDIHPHNTEIALRATRLVGLDVAGIDIICQDIARSLHEQNGGIVEVNAAPGFRMHMAPTEGKPRNVAGPVIDMLFPQGSNARIPLVAITGTNGKTTTSRIVAHILKISGKRTGLTTTDGIYINEERILHGDMTGPWSARVVLSDPTVEAAVFESARGGILREGLGWDRCDVGCVLNVTADHLGLRDVNTLEDMAHIKQLVVEVVHDNGTSVLNADDPLVRGMAKKAGGNIVWFTLQSDNPIVQEHVRTGGTAAIVENDVNGEMLSLYEGERRIPIISSHLVPATFEGKARFNVQNVLAAAAISHAIGVSLEHIRQGLCTFSTSFSLNPGRCNFFDEHQFRVIVDYGHNPAAMSAMADFIKQLCHKRTIGVVSAAGDRRNEDIFALGHVAASAFDLLFCKEDNDRRGRAPGESAALLAQGARNGGLEAEQVVIELDELTACKKAMSMAERGDLVVLFADDPAAAWKTVIYWSKEVSATSTIVDGTQHKQ